jgi:hypothetical protein
MYFEVTNRAILVSICSTLWKYYVCKGNVESTNEFCVPTIVALPRSCEGHFIGIGTDIEEYEVVLR